MYCVAGLFACFTARFTKMIMQVCFSIVLRLARYTVSAIIPICSQTEQVKPVKMDISNSSTLLLLLSYCYFFGCQNKLNLKW